MGLSLHHVLTRLDMTRLEQLTIFLSTLNAKNLTNAKKTKNIANQMSIYLNSSSFSHSFSMFIMHEKQNFGPIIFQHGGSATQYEKKQNVVLLCHIMSG